MYRVEVKNACKCFFKSGLAENSVFDTKAEAKEEADYMLGIMNSNFCHKHTFVLNEMGNNYEIIIKPNIK